jgi:hypothetical protein
LTPAEAGRALCGFKGRPAYERTMYLVFSLREGERERERAKGDERLYAAMLEGTQAAMRVFAREIGARELVWVASAQPDYPQPRVKD